LRVPVSVFDDRDIELSVKSLPPRRREAPSAKYRNAGQICVCANRILVQDGVYDAFSRRLAETAGAMKVADGSEPGAVIGPLIDTKAVEKVEAHIADAVKKGARVVAGDRRSASAAPSSADGADRCDDRHDYHQGETFGPVAPLYRFNTDEDG
jgi:succinate-semialdehyde dehydrogenase/glutarate-semialdehyde dehydrogenase